MEGRECRYRQTTRSDSERAIADTKLARSSKAELGEYAPQTAHVRAACADDIDELCINTIREARRTFRNELRDFILKVEPRRRLHGLRKC